MAENAPNETKEKPEKIFAFFIQLFFWTKVNYNILRLVATCVQASLFQAIVQIVFLLEDSTLSYAVENDCKITVWQRFEFTSDNHRNQKV